MLFLRELYWTVKLLGMDMDTCKGIIMSQTDLKFRRVGDVCRTPWFRKNRLNLHFNEQLRVYRVTVG